MQQGYFSLGNWRCVPVSAHWSILLWLPLYAWLYSGFAPALSAFLALATLLMAPEVGHAAMALWPPLYYMVLQPPLTVFITVNIIIAVLNLLPIAPLDGARAWRAVPLLLHWLTPRIKTLPHDLADTLNVKKRHAMQKESARLAAQLLERLNKK